MNSKEFKIRWVQTPKCKDCIPTSDMMRRRSCMGCPKYYAYEEKNNKRRVKRV